MDVDTFRKYLEDNYLGYAKWGAYVTEKINSVLIEKMGEAKALMFVKIPAVPRVKEIGSALGKVARKGYADPVTQMTDLVGVRFVVLLSEQMDLICKVIRQEPSWSAEVSKDYQDEIEQNPKIFDYQSQHFELRPKTNFYIDGCVITTDMCCEVQVRTLLQHAYAELVHDSIYKPVGPVPRKAERQVAKSMALMETTDELFCNTMRLLTDANQARNQLLEDLTALYREKIGGQFLKADEKTNYAVLDEYRDVFRDGLSADIGIFIERKKYIPTQTAKRAPANPFYAQPILLFVYWMVSEMDPDEVKRRWPLPGYLRELDMIFSDLDRKPNF
ncbi:GTP pyrophosphokinase [Aeromonas salmonicida]